MAARRTIPLALTCSALLACARASDPAQDTGSGPCDPAACAARCAPMIGSCASGSCVCLESCEPAECSAGCRASGHPDGTCVGHECQCIGTAADADAGGDDDVGDADLAEDTAEDLAPEDADAAEEAPWVDIGDPCSVDDLVEQVECGEGMKCTFGVLIDTIPDPFCDRAGPRDYGETCGRFSESDTCTAGGMCLNDGSGNRCRKLCRTDADCVDLGIGAGCTIDMRFGETIVEGTRACTFGCDVLTSTGCIDTLSCRPRFEAGMSYTDCTATGSGTQGSDCSTRGPADCARRYQCFTVTGVGEQCLYICELRLFGSDCPGAGLACQDIGDPAGVLGACI